MLRCDFRLCATGSTRPDIRCLTYSDISQLTRLIASRTASVWKSSGTTKTRFLIVISTISDCSFDFRALAVGVIVTRCDELETIFKDLVKRGLKPSSSYGESTTHMGKLAAALRWWRRWGAALFSFSESNQSLIRRGR
jgi:hypothetical protein